MSGPEATRKEPAERIHVPKRIASKHTSQAESPPAPQFIADTVKMLILDEKLSLGAPVTEKWMTEHFHASRTTVREALNLLVSARYLDREPYKSARVRSFSSGEVADIIEARHLIEGFAADGCADASAESKTRLRKAFAAYASASTAGHHGDEALAHLDLHVAIVGLCGNRELVLAEHNLMIGSMLLTDLINWRLRDTEKMYFEHHRMVSALLEPSPEEARRLVDSHLDMILTAAHKRLPETQ